MALRFDLKKSRRSNPLCREGPFFFPRTTIARSTTRAIAAGGALRDLASFFSREHLLFVYVLHHGHAKWVTNEDDSTRSDCGTRRTVDGTLPGESTGQRKGQATCSSPVYDEQPAASLTHDYTRYRARSRTRVKFGSTKPPRFLAFLLLRARMQIRV